MRRFENDNAPASAGADTITFLSICSGIEAASVAWPHWHAVAFAEIEKFPSAVLAHHYPDVPNLGDFTKIDTRKLGRIDILCGGTPCQAFSVAGLRQSLADERGNLSLEYVRLAHELADGNGLRNAVWENVPGVLSTKDNAFGCFLAGLVGADTAVIPSAKPRDGKSSRHWKWRKGGRYPVLDDEGEPTGEFVTVEPWHALTWPSHGMVSGPKGRAAWAVKDGQFFGVAQRRRRVIVVADFGDGADPGAVLFEPESLPRHSPPSREAGQGVARPIAESVAIRGRDGGATAELGGSIATALRASQGGGDKPHVLAYTPEIARCVATREGSSQDYESTTMVAVASIHADAVGRSGEAKTAQADASGIVRLRDPGTGIIDDGTTYNLMASGHPHAVCVTGQITHSLTAEGHDASEDGSGRGAPIIAFTAKDYGGGAAVNVSPGLRSGGRAGSHANAGVMPAVAFNTRQDPIHEADCAQRLSAKDNGNGVLVTSAVRRLTPVECERLQGFPDGYTDIPWRGKPNSPDGPRYKALGNSWAVPKFAWLGRRIEALMPDRSQQTIMKKAA